MEKRFLAALCRIVAICLAITLLQIECAAQVPVEENFCMLRVSVVTEDGTPFVAAVGIPVLVVDAKDERLIATLETRNGEAELCDVDRPFNVLVGKKGCGRVTVESLRPV